MIRILAFLLGSLTALGCFAQLPTGNNRGGDAVIPELNLGIYAYAPTIMDDGVFKMWYCSSPGAGVPDNIFYSESNALDTGWSRPVIVFRPRTSSPNVGGTPNQSDFDRGETCDPSVIRVNGTYYMYYGGNWQLDASGRTAIGVATSQDGINWTRMNNGRAIIRPKNEVDGIYGAGQPSVFFRDGLFYMLYVDNSTEYPVNVTNQIFVLRSSDPTFQANVDELQGLGNWVRLSGPPARTFTPFQKGVASLDWRYDDMLGAVAVAIPSQTCDSCLNIVKMFFYDLNLNWTGNVIDVPGHWVEGPGLVHRADGHAPLAYDMNHACGTVPLDLVRPVGGSDPGTWRLSHTGLDYFTTCGGLINLSTRGRVETQDRIMFSGLTIAGSTPRNVLIRGFSYSVHAVDAVPLPNPVLKLFNSANQQILINDNWPDAANAGELAPYMTATPPYNREAGMVLPLNPGNYTVWLYDAFGSSGLGMIAIDDLDNPRQPLLSLSTRAVVGTDANQQIAGFIIQGSAPSTPVLIRAIGPSLAGIVPQPLPNPTITLFRSSDNAVIAVNDDWQLDARSSELNRLHLGPTHSAESALLRDLPPGGYTVIVSAKPGTPSGGIGIVEVRTP